MTTSQTEVDERCFDEKALNERARAKERGVIFVDYNAFMKLKETRKASDGEQLLHCDNPLGRFRAFYGRITGRQWACEDEYVYGFPKGWENWNQISLWTSEKVIRMYLNPKGYGSLSELRKHKENNS